MKTKLVYMGQIKTTSPEQVYFQGDFPFANSASQWLPQQVDLLPAGPPHADTLHTQTITSDTKHTHIVATIAYKELENIMTIHSNTELYSL